MAWVGVVLQSCRTWGPEVLQSNPLGQGVGLDGLWSSLLALLLSDSTNYWRLPKVGFNVCVYFLKSHLTLPYQIPVNWLLWKSRRKVWCEKEGEYDKSCCYIIPLQTVVVSVASNWSVTQSNSPVKPRNSICSLTWFMSLGLHYAKDSGLCWINGHYS